MIFSFRATILFVSLTFKVLRPFRRVCHQTGSHNLLGLVERADLKFRILAAILPHIFAVCRADLPVDIRFTYSTMSSDVSTAPTIQVVTKLAIQVYQNACYQSKI
jgi:hypothetical protein